MDLSSLGQALANFFVEQVCKTWLRAIWKWFARLGWRRQLALIASLLIVLTPLVFPSAREIASHPRAAFAVLLSRGDGIPLYGAAKANTSNAIIQLSSLLRSKVRPPQLAGQAWTSAECLVAMRGDPGISPERTLQFLDTQRAYHFLKSPEADGALLWQEWPATNEREHLGATAWTIYSLSVIQAKVSTQDLRRILGFQFKASKFPTMDGAWPIYAGTVPRPEHASTYATAMLVVALAGARGQFPMGVPFRDSLDMAIEQAAIWLWKNEDKSQSLRWSDYPSSHSGKVSVGVTGLSVYALIAASSTGGSDLGREWLRSLPVALPNPQIGEVSEQGVELVQRPPNLKVPARAEDHTRNYSFQWSLIATSAVYKAAGYCEKVRATDWANRLLARLTPQVVLDTHVTGTWIAAELLNSLRRVLGSQDPGPVLSGPRGDARSPRR